MINLPFLPQDCFLVKGERRVNIDEFKRREVGESGMQGVLLGTELQQFTPRA